MACSIEGKEKPENGSQFRRRRRDAAARWAFCWKLQALCVPAGYATRRAPAAVQPAGGLTGGRNPTSGARSAGRAGAIPARLGQIELNIAGMSRGLSRPFSIGPEALVLPIGATVKVTRCRWARVECLSLAPIGPSFALADGSGFPRQATLAAGGRRKA
ncbi:hypothetical protein AEB_P1619 [Altererythrobacter sp. B11]|nr:hypothetical protein AEB_P1619 [Altererythrobacter sp. B11]